MHDKRYMVKFTSECPAHQISMTNFENYSFVIIRKEDENILFLLEVVL